MLLYFKTSNNLSYREEINFSMIAGVFSEHLENTIQIEKYKTKALKTSAIYGANASGKSNLLIAIANGVVFIQNSFTDSLAFDKMTQHLNRNDEKNKSKPTTYVYGLLIDGIQFEYSFSFNKDRILEEQLLEYRTQKPIQHFLRKFDSEKNDYNWNFSSLFTGKKDTVKEMTNSKTLFLTIGSKTELMVSIKVMYWFRNNIVWSINNDSPGNISVEYTLENILSFPDHKKVILEFLKEADFTIIDILVEKTQYGFKGTTLHKTININGEPTLTAFDLTTEESTGTNRFLSWIGVWLDILNNGKTLLVDELGNSMHSLLSKYLITKFHAENPQNSQLIFTTHDTNLMTQDIFRRDQIWIVDRDKTAHIYLVGTKRII